MRMRLVVQRALVVQRVVVLLRVEVMRRLLVRVRRGALLGARAGSRPRRVVGGRGGVLLAHGDARRQLLLDVERGVGRAGPTGTEHRTSDATPTIEGNHLPARRSIGAHAAVTVALFFQAWVCNSKNQEK